MNVFQWPISLSRILVSFSEQMHPSFNGFTVVLSCLLKFRRFYSLFFTFLRFSLDISLLNVALYDEGDMIRRSLMCAEHKDEEAILKSCNQA